MDRLSVHGSLKDKYMDNEIVSRNVRRKRKRKI